jgi:hypothetical protein
MAAIAMVCPQKIKYKQNPKFWKKKKQNFGRVLNVTDHKYKGYYTAHIGLI